MRITTKSVLMLLMMFFFAGTSVLLAQDPDEIEILTETSEPEDFGEAPLDDVTKKEIMTERRVLDYQPVRESDIVWEKRIWRIVDIR